MESTNTTTAWGYPEGETKQGPNNSILITDKEGYEYEIPERKDLHNIFQYESEDLK